MSNVVHLNVPSRNQREAERHTALLRSFAQHRRFGDDVFWLKENFSISWNAPAQSSSGKP